HLGYADVEDKYRGLENVKADQLFHQIALNDDDKKTNHHQSDHNPVVVKIRHHHAFSSPSPAASENAKKIRIMAAATVMPTPSSIRIMPMCWPLTGSSANAE